MSNLTRGIYSRADLERLINPKSIAVVGASETRGSFGERSLSNLADFPGKVYAVNPKYQNLLGRPCVPSVADLPETPDCVVLCVARPLVEGMIEAAGKIGAGGAVIYASGYSETAITERVDAQERLTEISRRNNVRLVGPNCMGVANVASRAGMTFMPGYSKMGHRTGPIGIVSQSGALGYIMLQAMERGVGFSHFLAAGNSCDADVCDFISYLAEHEGTRAIIALFEGVKDGARFLTAARKARDAGKALIVYKAGNSAASGQAALSHTGTMVGSSAAYQAAILESGAIAVDDLEMVLEMAAFFAKSGPPEAGRAVGVLATSGGAAVIAADKSERHGVTLPAMQAKTAAILHEVVPDFGSVANPADVTAEVLKTAEPFIKCLDAFLHDTNFSALVLPVVFANAASSGARVPAMIEAAGRTTRPLAVVWMTEWYQGPGSEVLDADPKVPIFRSMDRCFATLRAWFDWHDWRPGGTAERLADTAASATARRLVNEAVETGAALSETVSKQVLAAYGIPVPREILAANPDTAGDAAMRIGFPVAVKIASADILHKTEVGGIRLGLADEAQVRDATADILAAAARAMPNAKIDGVSVQQMAPPGIEMVIGVKNDLQFGPLIAAGLGGTMVEILRDTAVRLAPVTRTAARQMLASLKVYPLLTGFRGGAGVDIERLIDVICRVSELADDLRDVIGEIDVNPVIVSATGAVAADALIITKLDLL